MRVCLTMIPLCLLLAACQSTVGNSDADLPIAAASLPSDLHEISAPAQIGPWQYQGDLIAEQRDMRLFRYQIPGEPEASAQVTVYPMAPGWHEQDPERIIAGHFPLVREQAVQHLLKQGAINVEQTVSPLLASKVTRYPIARAWLQANTPRRTLARQVLVTGKQPWLIRLDMTSSTNPQPDSGDDTGNHAADDGLTLLEGFVEQL